MKDEDDDDFGPKALLRSKDEETSVSGGNGQNHDGMVPVAVLVQILTRYGDPEKRLSTSEAENLIAQVGVECWNFRKGSSCFYGCYINNMRLGRSLLKVPLDGLITSNS
jgi:hypothetical protein